MSEQEQLDHPQEAQETFEERVLPPLSSPPVEEPETASTLEEEAPPAGEGTAAEEVPLSSEGDQAKGEATAEPPSVQADEGPVQETAAAESPPPLDVAVPDQETEEAALFRRPRRIKDLKPGMVLEGKVTSVALYGAFVDIGVGREGLVHISQLSEEPVSSPTDVVQIGDMVTVRVLDVDVRNRRISLTMREQKEPEIDREKLRELTPGAVVDGTVASLTRFGVFVDIGAGRDGLVPRSQTEKGGNLQVGDGIRVRVLDVDQKSGRIRLSMRGIYDPQLFASLEAGSIVQGHVTSLATFGAFVDIGVGKDGLLHISELGEGIRHPGEVLEVGEQVEVRIVDIDPESQRISLSLQLEEEEAWLPEWQEEVEEEAPAPAEEATLEDLVSRFNAMRPGTRGEQEPAKDQGAREKRAVREALQRTLEEMRQQEGG